MLRLGRVVSLIGLVFLLTGFSSSEITFKSLSVAGRSAGGDFPAALGRPDGPGPFPAVVMIPPCGGLTETLSVDWARTIELIEGAHHAWDAKRFSTPHNDPAGNVMLYSEEATKKSHEIVRDFLATHVKK